MSFTVFQKLDISPLFWATASATGTLSSSTPNPPPPGADSPAQTGKLPGGDAGKLQPRGLRRDSGPGARGPAWQRRTDTLTVPRRRPCSPVQPGTRRPPGRPTGLPHTRLTLVLIWPVSPAASPASHSLCPAFLDGPQDLI